MKLKYIISFLVFLFFLNIDAQNPDFEIRRNAYIENGLNHLNSNSIIFQAYKNTPIEATLLNEILNNIASNTTADFDIVKLIRILFLSNGEYDNLILPILEPIPFWLTKDEKLRVYWSENHMIMWMSSNWLLHEKYGKQVDDSLNSQLKHLLKLKVDYGFYEFFSSVYLPYSLSGLLNLADFAQDAEIKHLATQAAQKLLKDILLLTNNQGVFFPAAGRNYYNKYTTPFNQNHNNLIFLLTGMGEVPTSVSHSGSFLATSSIDVTSVISSWTSVLNSNFTVGHSLLDGVNTINKNIPLLSKVIFQWSSGAYFDPEVALSTATILNEYNLWNHDEFKDFKDFKGLPLAIAPTLARIASSISKSSGIYNPNITIFKNNSVTLSSVQDFWKGKNGYQQFPVVANTGTSAVFPISGKVAEDLENRSELHANTHLPYVKQTDNIALVMYRPEKGLALFGYIDNKLDIALKWDANVFDEIREDNNWIIGREKDGYIAVRRHCTDSILNKIACDNHDGQTWIIVVGNIEMYGSFDNFENIIKTSIFESKWYFDLPTLQWAYQSKINIDNKVLEYTWYADIFSFPTEKEVSTAIINKKDYQEISVYPNPANTFVNLSFPNSITKNSWYKIYNTVGETVLQKEIEPTELNNLHINTTTFSNGLYFINIETKDQIYTGKIIIQK